MGSRSFYKHIKFTILLLFPTLQVFAVFVLYLDDANFKYALRAFKQQLTLKNASML